MSRPRRIAVVHDWLDTWRGGENVLAEILALYPDADLFALVDFFPQSFRQRIGGKHARTSFLQHIPGARRHFRALLPLFARAVESLDFSGYELIISSSHAVAKNARTSAGQLHVCYCHTPMRYAWDQRQQYLAAIGATGGLRGSILRQVLDRLRDWDRRSSERVNRFVANSAYIRGRIERCYGRDAEVIFPPVDVEFFAPPTDVQRKPDVYVTASRWVPYKRVDLIVEAFRHLPARHLVVIGEGPDEARVRSAAGPNVQFVGEVTRERLRELLSGARAFVFAAEEDFGILPVEAQACGTPVVAYGAGGALETVRPVPEDRPTGVFFPKQTSEAIVAAIHMFEALPRPIDAGDCRVNAEAFSVSRFRSNFAALIECSWGNFAAGER